MPALAVRLLPRVDDLRAERAAVLRTRLAGLEAALARELPGWTWQRPAGGAALWIRLPAPAGAAVFSQVALRHGVELVPGAATDPSGDHDAYVRLPFTLPEPRLVELVELVARLARAWAAYGGTPSAG
ncbi:hypothetical protein [Streptomyces sp. NBC_01207]|uniref:hypothetical protein n=1 Tax=Streptomyces sp. NBC_01207 TaxID=2903772 RepID=UPI002E162A8D|nr:hypothetical protein OG457_10240 [Streptomyces sp. NBC_01207]